MPRIRAKSYHIPAEATLEIIGGKWKILILCHLTKGAKRTSELKKGIPSVTLKMMTQQLRELEEDGLVKRTVYNQVPPKVVYELTESGWTLQPILSLLCKWGEQYVKDQPEKSDGA